MLWRDADGHDLLAANVADGKATRFSYGELAPIIDFDRTPGYRSSAWILPLLYCSLAILLLTGLLWPTRLLVRRKYKAELRPRGPAALAYRSSRIAAIADRGAPHRLAGRRRRPCSATLPTRRAFNSILLLLELLSIIVFIGGFAVMLWYAYTAWRDPAGAGPARCGASCSSSPSGTVLYIGLVFKLIGARRPTTDGRRSALPTASRRTGSRRRSGSRAMCSRRRTWSSSSSATAGAAAAARRRGCYYLGDDADAHRRRARARIATAIEHCGSRERPARSDAARRCAQRRRLRDVGARGEARPDHRRASSPGSASPSRWSPPSRSAPTTRQAMADGARRLCRRASDQGQADRRARARRRAGPRHSRSAARRLARRRRQPGLSREQISIRWSRP